jgi:hypothetical protein
MAMKKQVKTRLWIFLRLAALALPLNLGAGQPDVQEVLRGVRMNQGSQHRVMRAQLRHGARVVPFRLVLNGSAIRYEFSNPEQTLVLRLGDNSSELEEIAGGNEKRVTAARFNAPVRDTDVTYEDLALRFLYWPEARMLAEDNLAEIRCHVVELHPGAGTASQYGKVIAWIGKLAGVLVQAECYAPDGRLVARFKFRSFQTLADGARFLKLMRIERMENGKTRDGQPTILEIEGEEK